MRKRNIHTILISVAALSAFAFILFVLSLTFKADVTNYFNRTEFDSLGWKSWQESEGAISLRLNMVHDLQEKYKLEGMTVTETIELLGEPDQKSETEFSYYLGYSGHGINTAHLFLVFDGNKVKRFYLWEG